MKRRDFLWKGSGLLGLAASGQGFGRIPRKDVPATGGYEKITNHVDVFKEVVNVGLIHRHGKVLLIDSGEGAVLQEAQNPGFGAIEGVLYTHYHRDQCSGASLLQNAGAKIVAPSAETNFFRDATQFWLEADNILDHRYNFRPELMVLRESVVPDQGIKPGEVFNWQGIGVHAIATPGHTDGSLTYIFEIDGKTIAFTGDLIYGPGQILEFYSLQKRFQGMGGGYWGFGGTVNELLKSLETVLSYKPSVIVPSHGTVITDPQSAVELLKSRIDGAMKNYFTLSAWRIYQHNGNPIFKADAPPPFDVPMLKLLPPVALPTWMHRSVETSSYIVAEDKSIFLFDCGFPPIAGALDKLVKSGEISRVDGIWISHYHDDHVVSVNEIRRKYGARVYVQKEIQDILENPTAYCMPCLFPESIHVDHALSEGEVINWKGYKLTGYYFPGQTLFHDGLLIDHEGTRVFMSGDSFANWGIDDYCSYNRNFIGKDGEKAGYGRCLKLLQELKPDLLVAAHWGPEPLSGDYLQRTVAILREREKLFSDLFPWEDPNFGLDPHWIRAYPFRQSVLPGQRVSLEARVFNHSDSSYKAVAELRVPKGWRVEKLGSITIQPHSEGRIPLAALSPAHPLLRREVLGVAVRFGDRNLGEFAVAIVDYLQ